VKIQGEKDELFERPLLMKRVLRKRRVLRLRFCEIYEILAQVDKKILQEDEMHQYLRDYLIF